MVLTEELVVPRGNGVDQNTIVKVGLGGGGEQGGVTQRVLNKTPSSRWVRGGSVTSRQVYSRQRGEPQHQCQGRLRRLTCSTGRLGLTKKPAPLSAIWANPAAAGCSLQLYTRM
jgi:hypothetical protein